MTPSPTPPAISIPPSTPTSRRRSRRSGYATLFQAVEAWREEAFRYAEQLASAPDDAARALVAQAIEQNAANTALLIRAGNAYGPSGSSASRDAYCASHQPGS